MITSLSILIPVYNNCPMSLVAELQKQAAAIDGLRYEIVIVDDGSTDEQCLEQNKQADMLAGCRYVYMQHHDGHAAMRNDLQRLAQYDWRLTIDARLTIAHADFVMRYVACGIDNSVPTGIPACAYGGVETDGGADTEKLYRENLRFRYEKFEERNHRVNIRSATPYLSLRTTNFLCNKQATLLAPYDERLKGYGYEDVMHGRLLKQLGVKIMHIDNPVTYTSFEPNAVYLGKLEEALRTLHKFSAELRDYSPLLQLVNKLDAWHLLPLLRMMHKLCGRMMLKNLKGNRPRLLLLKLYKLGYYVCLPDNLV